MTESEKDLEELLEWPPKDWKDNFKRPTVECLCMKNAMPDVITRLIDGEEGDESNKDLPKTRGDQVGRPASFFSTENNLTQVNVKDMWAEWPVESMPGDAKSILFHRDDMELMQLYKKLKGGATLCTHNVPHKDKFGIYVVKELFLYPNDSMNQDLRIEQQEMIGEKCFRCKNKSAMITCRCGVPFCEEFCRQLAQEELLHTTTHCKRKYTLQVGEDIQVARKRIQVMEKLVTEEHDRAAQTIAMRHQGVDPNEMQKKLDAKSKSILVGSALNRIRLGMDRDKNIPDEFYNEAMKQYEEIQKQANNPEKQKVAEPTNNDVVPPAVNEQ